MSRTQDLSLQTNLDEELVTERMLNWDLVREQTQYAVCQPAQYARTQAVHSTGRADKLESPISLGHLLS